MLKVPFFYPEFLMDTGAPPLFDLFLPLWFNVRQLKSFFSSDLLLFHKYTRGSSEGVLFTALPTGDHFHYVTFVYTHPQRKRTTMIFNIIFFCGKTVYAQLIVDKKTKNHSSVTCAYVQTAWFISLGCGQHFASFLAIGNQGVIEKLEESRPESPKIETVTSLGIA